MESCLVLTGEKQVNWNLKRQMKNLKNHANKDKLVIIIFSNK